jgi:hypothetical protein
MQFSDYVAIISPEGCHTIATIGWQHPYIKQRFAAFHEFDLGPMTLRPALSTALA